MRARFGSQIFENVSIPVLWGKRAVIGHPSGALSIVSLADSEAKPEIIGDAPASLISFSEQEDGYVIYAEDTPQYFYSPARRLIRDLTGRLPDCTIRNNEITIGTNRISGSMISGFGVGVGITEQGFFIGGPIPEGLAPLVLRN